jgi:hypothetical protein
MIPCPVTLITAPHSIIVSVTPFTKPVHFHHIPELESGNFFQPLPGLFGSSLVGGFGYAEPSLNTSIL